VRLGRRFAVRYSAFGLRHGATVDQLRAALDRSYRHRPPDWRDAVLADAIARNRHRLMKKINAA
jgi:hypothetical protein